MIGSMILIVSLGILAATAVLSSGRKDPDHERQPGEEREVLPEVKLMAYAACALGVTGAMILSGKLRDISVPASTVDMNSFNKAFASFNTRAQFLRPRVTGFVKS